MDDSLVTVLSLRALDLDQHHGVNTKGQVFSEWAQSTEGQEEIRQSISQVHCHMIKEGAFA